MSPSNASVNLSYPAFTGSTVNDLTTSNTSLYKGFFGSGKIKAGLSATLKPSSFIMLSIQFSGGMTGLGLGKTKSDFAFGSGNINSAITLPV